MGRVTLQTIADRVGVSRMTVSNAFSRPDQLSADLRRRILDAAEELGYAGPDPAARALARGSTGAVGVLLTSSLQYAFQDEVAALFLGAIAQELTANDLALTLLPATATGEHVAARDVALDGALVYSCERNSAAVAWLHRRKLPLVYVDQSPVAGITSVNIDDRGGAAAAAQHLVDLGHRHVAVVTVNHGSQPGIVTGAVERATSHVGRQRILGCFDALHAAGIEPVVVQQPYSSEEPGRDAARTILGLDPRPTAVLCFSDAMAWGVVLEARDQGVDVPAGLSVIGFDDNPLASRVRPALTTVRQDVGEKGRLAALELLGAMARARQGGSARAKRIVLPAELVVRASTAAAPA